MNDLANEVSKALREYRSELSDDIQQAVERVAKAGVEKLKKISPKLTGQYSKSWKYKVAYKGSNGERAIIYNSGNAELTHLLENGHALKNGGRTRSFPHISVVEAETQEKLINELEKVLK